MFRVACWFRTIAITAQVCTDHSKSLCKNGGYMMPADMSLWIAVQQQDGITTPPSNEVDYYFLCFDLLTSETIEHGSIRSNPWLFFLATRAVVGYSRAHKIFQRRFIDIVSFMEIN